MSSGARVFRAGCGKIYYPAWLLFFLAPAIAELLSGSAPPSEFFNPFIFLLLLLIYGGGANLIRELTHRWKKGWPTILILGAAYGIVEEGLGVKSFFDPNWVDLGQLGSYGRLAGVNWIWSLNLTIYHAVFSITIPIALVDLLFSERRQESWLSRRSFNLLAGLFTADIIFCFLRITNYRPPIIPYLLAGVAVFVLGILARRIPKNLATLFTVSTRYLRPFWFGLTGLLATTVFFLLLFILPNTKLPPLLTIFCTLAMAFLVYRMLSWMAGNVRNWTERHRLALISGSLGFFILVAPLQELDKKRPDNTAGMALIGLATAVFLYLTVRLMKQNEHDCVKSD